MTRRPTYEELGRRVDELERKLVESEAEKETLRWNETNFRNVIERAQEGVLIIQNTKIVFANTRACEFLGYSKEEIKGRAFIEYVHPDDREWLIDQYLKKLAGKDVQLGRSYRVLEGGDRIRWVQSRSIQIEWYNESALLSFLIDVTGIKVAEEALRGSEEKYRNLVEESFDGIFIQRGPNIIFANKRLNEMLGYEAGELIGLSHWLLYHPDYQELVRERAQARMRKEQVVNRYEVKLQRKDGSSFFGEVNARAIRFSPSEESGIQVWVKDIDDRKRAEEALREREAYVNAVVDNLPVGVAVNSVDPDVTFSYMNDNFPKFYRTTREALTNPDAFWDSVYEDPVFRKQMRKRILDDCAGGDPECMHWEDVPIARQGKETAYISARNTPVPGKKLMISTVWDVTDRKRAELALRESEEKFRNFTEHSFVGFYITQDGIFKYVNPKFAEIFGYTVQECLDDMHFRWLVHPEDLDKVQEQVRRRITGETEATHYTFRGVKRTGDIIQVAIYGSSLIYKERPAAIGTVLDITRQQEMEKRMAQSQRMEAIGSLAGGIAHDFNNILFPIVGLSEILMDDLSNNTQQYENAEQIFRAGMRGSDLVKQILAFSRQAVKKKMPIRLQQILKEVMKLSRSTIPANISITGDIQDDCRLVLANPTQVHQIVMNLITNAYHAVEQTNGEISVQLKETDIRIDDLSDTGFTHGRYALLSVSDTGEGIDPMIIGKIFEPYFTTKAQGKGTGLGLAVVYGIVKDHKGEIKVKSELGKGSTFNVYLPIMEEAENPQWVEEIEIHLTGHERILLVDDEEPIARLEKQMLERLGYQVTSRISSAEALATFRANSDLFELVISDMSMPDMTGVQLARELIAIRPDIPIIICTGFSERTYQKKVAAIGVKGFLMKPFVKSEMANMVRKVLDEVKG